jgi:hypothetical protein
MRKHDVKRRSVSRFAGDLERSPVSFDDAFACRQSQAYSRNGSARRLCPVEGLEDIRLVLWTYSYSLIANGNVERVSLAPGFDAYNTAIGRIFDRVR